LKKHLDAAGFYPDTSIQQNIRYIILEDYGTTGLDGEIKPEIREGNFYNFWWREGISEKSNMKCGRWGLGKVTFYVVSEIRTCFGLTVREDKKELLMGKCLLKTHDIGNVRYLPDGTLCGGDFLPIQDKKIIDKFKEIFNIQRKDEPGLSIVIPYLVNDVNQESILKGAIRHYFYPILRGGLGIKLNDIMINSENLIEKVESINWENTEFENFKIGEIFNFVKSGILNNNGIKINLNDIKTPCITENSFSADINNIREQFRNGDILKFKIPMKIKKVGDDEKETYFEIVIKKFSEFKNAFE
jgi:hypothetical protein